MRLAFAVRDAKAQPARPPAAKFAKAGGSNLDLNQAGGVEMRCRDCAAGFQFRTLQKFALNL